LEQDSSLLLGITKYRQKMEGVFNEEFCERLAYRLGETFRNSELPELKGYWCDGVSHLSLLDNQTTQKNVNDTHIIVTEAWIGKDGQDLYEMIIHFGPYALRRFAKGMSISDCIPDVQTMDWVEIDLKKKQIDVRLK
jgi:hypothetical protein